MSAKQRRLEQLRQQISEVTPTEARELQRQGAILIDVREPDEVALGSVAGAKRIVRGYLELRIEDVVPDPDAELLVMCAGGTRSLFAAENLQQLGYRAVRSVRGGFDRWSQEGLPVEVPATLNAEERERYSRHLSIPEVGEEGQAQLMESKVLLVGAGGLGSPALERWVSSTTTLWPAPTCSARFCIPKHALARPRSNRRDKRWKHSTRSLRSSVTCYASKAATSKRSSPAMT